jgi:hypothetical protein
VRALHEEATMIHRGTLLLLTPPVVRRCSEEWFAVAVKSGSPLQ